MTNQLHTTFWALPPQQIHTQSQDLRHRMGITDSTRKQKVDTMQNNREAQEQLSNHNLQHLTARQAFQHLRGQHSPAATIALPATCNDLPPEQPNVYTDGSLINPTDPYFCLGGAGAWHPQRQLDDTGTTEAEANLAVLEQEASGLKLFTQIGGYGGSSTRMEIAGAIIGIAAKGAVHIGTDSSSFMRKAITLHHHINNHTTPKRPWPLQRDGDLWHLYFQHATAKSATAITITKVKGHATDNMVETGQVQIQDKVGNDKADEAADEGVALFGDPLVKLSKCYTERHIAYSQLVADIHEHIAFMYKVRAALLQHHSDSPTNTTTNHPPNNQPITTQQAAPPTHHTKNLDSRRFTQVIMVQQCPVLCKRLPAITHIQAFLMDMPYHTIQQGEGSGGGQADGTSSVRSADAVATNIDQATAEGNTHQSNCGNGSSQAVGTSSVDSADTAATHGTQATPDSMGTTWLELYTLYRMTGHPEPVTYNTTQATVRPTLRQQLHTFRHTTRQLVINTMPQQAHTLFKGKSDMHGKRLGTLGINTNLAILPWQPDITPSTRTRIAQEILRSQHRLSLKQACAALEEGKAVALRQLQLKGRAKWSANIKPHGQAIYNQPTRHDTATSTKHTTQAIEQRGHYGRLGFSLSCAPPPTRYHQPTNTAASTQPHDYHDPGSQAQHQPHTKQHIPTPPLPQHIFFGCPRCTHRLPGTRTAFRHDNLDERIWCNICKRARFIGAWRCQCGIPWHQCPLHKHEPARLRSEQAAPPKAATPEPNNMPRDARTTTTRGGTKRYLGTGQDEHINRWLDTPAHKQPRCTPTHIDLEDNNIPSQPNNNKRALKTHLLGPKLLAKLARFTSDTSGGHPPPTTSNPPSGSSGS